MKKADILGETTTKKRAKTGEPGKWPMLQENRMGRAAWFWEKESKGKAAKKDM